MHDVLTEIAPAKVNLSLHVTGKRADGYHLLDGLVVFAGVGDVVRGRLADRWSLDVVGPFASGLAGESDNLVLRAARALAGRVGHGPAALTLEKNLPVASGIGGGSADAAATLRLLARLWRMDPTTEPLRRMLSDVALGLGADVPMCLDSQPSRIQGIGDMLQPIPPLPPMGLLLVNPNLPLSTPEVFRARTGAFSAAPDTPARWTSIDALAADLQKAANDLEPAARSIRPQIGVVLSAIEALDGCLLARMSGSGATCFGLFRQSDTAADAARALRRPDWWCWGGALHGTA
jgi:4-diphosphocytidyl-2-C-methyl-D-erythritol kinase